MSHTGSRAERAGWQLGDAAQHSGRVGTLVNARSSRYGGPMAIVTIVLSLIALASVQLPAAGLVGPNRLLGIRVSRSLASPEAWRRVHRRALPFSWAGTIACWVLVTLSYTSALPAALTLALAAAVLGLVLGAWAGVARERRLEAGRLRA
ncbi:SdpI family protein [Leucobacter sp. UCMA 4100]|uniref:SdpI family protein n=1 Tax=Leucobacter sp. UCMA 4100 TaxID=2810534 RepID=UPI0022EB34F7|nr:SdpI family protein [Leucobacter sp. UCMA 4100]MDA3146722.1 SdpI family protein [Leucobacter sp. UCMA 4100]